MEAGEAWRPPLRAVHSCRRKLGGRCLCSPSAACTLCGPCLCAACLLWLVATAVCPLSPRCIETLPQVHGDVFRPPRYLEVLAALVGTGVQLALLVLSVILITIAGQWAHG